MDKMPDEQPMTAPDIPAVDTMANQIMVHVKQQLAKQPLQEPELADGSVKELKEFIENLAKREREKKCGDPDTLVTSSKPSMEGIKYCTVCKKTEFEWDHGPTPHGN